MPPVCYACRTSSTLPERLRVQFAVRRLYHCGTALREYTWRTQRPVVCAIRLCWVHDGRGARPVRIASCTAPDDSRLRRLIPDLYEAQLSALSEQGFLLEGYEHLAEAPGQPLQRLRQAWHVQFCA